MPKDCDNKRHRDHARRAGFTLFEVMLAALVLGTALVALVRMLDLGRVSLEADAKRAVALSLLRREVELVRARGYDALATEAAQALADAPDYSRSVTAVYAGGGLKLVTVTITWDSPTKDAVSESVQFVVADNVLPTWTWEMP
jgi:Tfp pilus assembly protein PilV